MLPAINLGEIYTHYYFKSSLCSFLSFDARSHCTHARSVTAPPSWGILFHFSLCHLVFSVLKVSIPPAQRSFHICVPCTDKTIRGFCHCHTDSFLGFWSCLHHPSVPAPSALSTIPLRIAITVISNPQFHGCSIQVSSFWYLLCVF